MPNELPKLTSPITVNGRLVKKRIAVPPMADFGMVDMVAVGRGYLCDPGWANKVTAGEGLNPCLQYKRCMWYVDGQT